MAMNTLSQDPDATNPAVITQTLSRVFARLLARYRDQVTQLDAADNQDEIDRLADASHDTLTTMIGTRVRTAHALADKIDALIPRYVGAVPMDHVRELLLDAHEIAVDPGFVVSWLQLWHGLGCKLVGLDDGTTRYFSVPDPVKFGEAIPGMPIHLTFNCEAEAVGATKALEAIVRMAGKRAADNVFAFAVVDQGEVA